MFWLSDVNDKNEERYIKRFDPRFWTVNFPRPMMAAVTVAAPGAMTVKLVFYRNNDLSGLIWESIDHYDHPLLGYETRKDYSRTKLQFRWQSSNIRALDEVYGPTLTIEGRNSDGASRTWYVRLWNYAVGDPDDAIITLDFDNLDGGFSLPGDADPVYPNDIDRLFISMVPPSYNGVLDGPIQSPPGTYVQVDGQVTISEVKTSGSGSSLKIGDLHVRPHRLRLANGYDDTYNVTPARVMRNAIQLGYRDWINHYVGMSHYYSLSWSVSEGRFIVDPAKPKLNAATEGWHQSFLQEAKRFGFDVIMAVSYELLADNAPLSWQQRTYEGDAALTGWSPPSTLLTPASVAALNYLRDVFLAFSNLVDMADLPVHVQIGEPWWWYQPGSGVPCFYDSAATALYTSETGLAVPTRHHSIFETPNSAQQAYLQWLGGKLGASTLWLRDAVKSAYSGAEVFLLFYTPQVLNPAAPMLKTVNFPSASWVAPAFDRLQVEDYDYVAGADWRAHEQALQTVTDELGYTMAETHYFSGFNLLPETLSIWTNIDAAIDDADFRGYDQTFVWAYPQIIRDGFVYNGIKENEVSGFHEIRFPEAVSFGSTGGPAFLTTVVETASGFEQRNIEWSQARASYEIGTGIRSEADLAAVVAFFRARAGRAYGFRFKDWTDYKSVAPGESITASDQLIGAGDGSETQFQLVKTYASGAGAHVRTIAKPVAGTVAVALNGVAQPTGWTVDLTTGILTFTTAPAAGVDVRAGFEFDVPVRFQNDRISVSLEYFRAGEAPSIGLIEIRV